MALPAALLFFSFFLLVLISPVAPGKPSRRRRHCHHPLRASSASTADQCRRIHEMQARLDLLAGRAIIRMPQLPPTSADKTDVWAEAEAEAEATATDLQQTNRPFLDHTPPRVRGADFQACLGGSWLFLLGDSRLRYMFSRVAELVIGGGQVAQTSMEFPHHRKCPARLATAAAASKRGGGNIGDGQQSSCEAWAVGVGCDHDTCFREAKTAATAATAAAGGGGDGGILRATFAFKELPTQPLTAIPGWAGLVSASQRPRVIFLTTGSWAIQNYKLLDPTFNLTAAAAQTAREAIGAMQEIDRATTTTVDACAPAPAGTTPRTLKVWVSYPSCGAAAASALGAAPDVIEAWDMARRVVEGRVSAAIRAAQRKGRGERDLGGEGAEAVEEAGAGGAEQAGAEVEPAAPASLSPLWLYYNASRLTPPALARWSARQLDPSDGLCDGWHVRGELVEQEMDLILGAICDCR